GSATDTSPSTDHAAAAGPGDGKRRPARGSSEPTAPPPVSASRSAPAANPYLPSQPTLIFSDPLTASSPAWAAEDGTSSLCRIDDRGLHVIAGPEEPRPGCRTAVEVSDATVEIEFSFTGARQAGLVFHRSGTEAGYTVGVTRDGTISLAAVVGNLPGPDLIPPRARPAFDPAGWHRLAITIVGTTMTLYLDDEPVGVASGDLRGGGVIGVVIDRGQVPGDQPAPAECTFRNLRVWTA
ncbi:MAG: DUF1080 domain-containing protein, partial [Micromonosporaceae bacterium]|nr:DUF1080 domain-containing protein [Micromonosporaceae bacterium]